MTRLVGLILALIFAGCMQKSEPAKSLKFSAGYEYFENDLNVSHIDFFIQADDKNVSEFAKLLALKSLTGSEIFALEKSENLSLLIINLDTNKSVSLSQKSTLQNAKGLKIYELKAGLIESMIYVSNSGICASWNKNKPIFARVVTNYYPFLNNATKEPFVTKFELVLEKSKGAYVGDFEIINTLLKGESASKIATLIKGDEFLHSLEADIIKQGRLLEFLCNKNAITYKANPKTDETNSTTKSQTSKTK